MGTDDRPDARSSFFGHVQLRSAGTETDRRQGRKLYKTVKISGELDPADACISGPVRYYTDQSRFFAVPLVRVGEVRLWAERKPAAPGEVDRPERVE